MLVENDIAVEHKSGEQKRMSNTPDYKKRFGKVAVVMGGKAAEREVSLNSGKAVLDALLVAGVDAIGIDAAADLPSQLVANRVERVFNVLHGRGGEDGQLQGLLEFMEIPFTGSGVLASALSMDKERTKRIWLSEGVPTPQFEMLTEQTDFSEVIARLGTVFVKPVREGSSIGMSIASDSSALESAYKKAAEYDSHVMAEQYISGPEFSVPVLNGVVLPVIELKTTHEFYDYDAKYLANDTEYICPAPLDDALRQELESVCLSAFESIGCSGWGRVDVMQDKDGKFWLLELNTVPGMTDHSLVPMSAKQKGLSFADLLIEILDTTVVQS